MKSSFCVIIFSVISNNSLVSLESDIEPNIVQIVSNTKLSTNFCMYSGVEFSTTSWIVQIAALRMLWLLFAIDSWTSRKLGCENKVEKASVVRNEEIVESNVAYTAYLLACSVPSISKSLAWILVEISSHNWKSPMLPTVNSIMILVPSEMTESQVPSNFYRSQASRTSCAASLL